LVVATTVYLFNKQKERFFLTSPKQLLKAEFTIVTTEKSQHEISASAAKKLSQEALAFQLKNENFKGIIAPCGQSNHSYHFLSLDSLNLEHFSNEHTFTGKLEIATELLRLEKSQQARGLIFEDRLLIIDSEAEILKTVLLPKE
jgi:3-hydroxymyristoyl/3-hydroxydecanoyl-(acyl carrier protein) dehydratase